MNRRVVQFGLGRLPHTSAPPVPSSRSPAKRLLSAVPFAPHRPLLAEAPLARLACARVFSSFPHKYHDAAAPNTVFAGPTLRLGLRRDLHARFGRTPLTECLARVPSRRWKFQQRMFSDRRSAEDAGAAEGAQKRSSTQATPSEASKPTAEQAGAAVASKTILSRLPHLHRPSKEELLAAATGFWHRVSIRFKWFSIRSVRPFNLDEIGAFLSWIFWGHVLWIVVGTTTFVSLAIWAVNTVFAQETLAGWVGNYLTKSSGIKVVFESAIVPKWKGGVITFQNVFVSRRPGRQAKRERSVSKGSSTTAAAAAAEAAMLERMKEGAHLEDDDGNYTQFDVTIQSVNVTLSFAKWFNGKGLLRDVEIHGVRGVIDRTHVHSTSSDEYVDPKSYRHEHNTGDFEIDVFKMEDVLLTLYQPNGFRPFTVSVFNCELPRLRKQWLFYDFMSANNMSGSFDDSLFTIHPRQVHGHTGAQSDDAAGNLDGHEWKKRSRLRVDDLNIDHLNRGVDGPFSWISEGNVDIVADVMIPNDDEGLWTKVMTGIHDQIDRMEATVTNSQAHGRRQPQAADAANEEQASGDEADNRFVVFDIRVQLNDVRASVPIFTKDLSYVNNALVRPIVAYINSRRAVIPVNCRVVKRQSEFDGSWTVFDSGLLDDLSRETYDAFARDIVDGRARKRRIKKVGLWTLQVAAQALFIGLAGQLA